MGFNPFSSKTVITTFSQTIPILEEVADDKNFIKEAIQYSIASNTDLPNNLLRSSVKRRGLVDLNSYYTYCKDNHPYGLPDSNRLQAVLDPLSPADETELENILINRYSNLGFLELNTYRATYLTKEDMLRVYLESYGARDSFTSDGIEVDNVNFRSSFIVNGTVLREKDVIAVNNGGTVTTGAGTPDSWLIYDIEGANFVAPNTADIDKLDVYSFKCKLVHFAENLDVFIEYNDVTLFAGFKRNLEGFRGYTFNLTSTGTIGNVTEIVIKYSIRNAYYSIPNISFTEKKFASQDLYPVMPIKLNSNYVGKEGEYFPDKDFYEKTSKALSKIAIDIDAVTERISQDTGASDTNGIYVAVGANMASKKEAELKYVFEFFKDEYFNNFAIGFGQNNYIQYTEGPNRDNFDQIQTYANIKYSQNRGVFPQRSSDSLVLEEKTISSTENYLVTAATSLNIVGGNGLEGSDPASGGVFLYFIRRQITPNEWEEIEVVDFYQERTIYRDYGQSNSVEEIYNNPDSNELRIPINKELLNNGIFSGKDIEEIEYFSVYLLVQGYDKQKLKFYETSFFRFFIQAIGFALFIVSVIVPGAQPAAILARALIAVGVAAVTRLIFDYLAPKIGGELAAVVVVAVVIASSGLGAEGGFDSIFSAEVALASTNAVSTSLGYYNEYELSLLQEEYAEIVIQAENAQEQIDDLLAKFDNILSGSDTAFIEGLFSAQDAEDFSSSYVNETPSQFIERTIHTTNPGVKILDNIPNYVSNNVSLPDMTKDIFS